MTVGSKILLTGATGFVGTHLYPKLRAAGHQVLCASRDPRRARERFPERAFARVDLLDAASVRAALENCQAAFYLVHGMSEHTAYEAVEARQAETFRLAAADARLERIIYLGGPRPSGTPSRHLQSRLRVGEILRRGPVPALELQASMIVGAGSESFRIVRDLAARLPLMVLPRWLETRTEPVAIDDVCAALAHALSVPLRASQSFALPGPEPMSGREILLRTAGVLGLAPSLLGVPFLTPRLSSFWIQWVTRADYRVAAQLVEGLTHDLISADRGFWQCFPEHSRLGFEDAVRRALEEDSEPLSLRARVGERLTRRIAGHAAHQRPFQPRAHP